MNRNRSPIDVDADELLLRDRPYESYGEQGLALPTYASSPPPAAAPDDRDVPVHVDDSASFRRGAERVDLGERVSRGKGPKGWQRRDDRIHEDICTRLTDDSHVDASNIEVVVHQGEISLSGSVPDREQRVRACHIAESVRGVIDVVNRLRVLRSR